MPRYIVIAPNMQWIRHWRGEEWRAGNMDMKSERNLICITSDYDIQKIEGIRPLDDDKIVWLGPPNGFHVLRALEYRGFKL